MNLRVTTILAAAGLVALGACAPMDGTGMSRTQQGALAGAAVALLIPRGQAMTTSTSPSAAA